MLYTMVSVNTFHFRELPTTPRVGGPTQLNLERYVEALSDPSSGLTYSALTGARGNSRLWMLKRLFSPKLAAFMHRKGYVYEAKYIETIWNWRRAL